MSFLESLRIAFDSIWSAKLRSFFTLLGIIVSVAFLVVVVAVIQGMNAYVKENLTGAMIGTNVGAFPVIIKNSDLSLWLFGLIGTIGMLSNIVLMAMGGFINRYADHRTVLLWILPLSFTALVFAQLAFSPLTFVIAAILISMCFGAMDLFMNAEGAAIEQLHEKTIFGAYHGSASLMMAIFAIISSMVSVAGIRVSKAPENRLPERKLSDAQSRKRP